VCRCRRNTRARALARYTLGECEYYFSGIFIYRPPDQGVIRSLSLFQRSWWYLPPCIIKYPSTVYPYAHSVSAEIPRAYLPSRKLLDIYRSCGDKNRDKYHACRQFFPPYFPSPPRLVFGAIVSRMHPDEQSHSFRWTNDMLIRVRTPMGTVEGSCEGRIRKLEFAADTFRGTRIFILAMQ